MPHLILEYSDSLQDTVDIKIAMKKGREIMAASQQFRDVDIKVRAIPFSEFEISEQYTDFLHVTIKLLKGRSIDIQTALTRDLFEYYRSQISDTTMLSVDIVEMTKETYQKI